MTMVKKKSLSEKHIRLYTVVLYVQETFGGRAEEKASLLW